MLQLPHHHLQEVTAPDWPCWAQRPTRKFPEALTYACGLCPGCRDHKRDHQSGRTLKVEDTEAWWQEAALPWSPCPWVGLTREDNAQESTGPAQVAKSSCGGSSPVLRPQGAQLSDREGSVSEARAPVHSRAVEKKGYRADSSSVTTCQVRGQE